MSWYKSSFEDFLAYMFGENIPGIYIRICHFFAFYLDFWFFTSFSSSLSYHFGSCPFFALFPPFAFLRFILLFFVAYIYTIYISRIIFVRTFVHFSLSLLLYVAPRFPLCFGLFLNMHFTTLPLIFPCP